jgi:hypothetical protein
MTELSHKERKQRPVLTGVLDYFPDAILEVANVSFIGNEQHNPGEPLHWAKDKSIGHGDEIVRHLMDRGKKDSDGTRHTAKLVWRALELLQREIEAEKKLTFSYSHLDHGPVFTFRTPGVQNKPGSPVLTLQDEHCADHVRRAEGEYDHRDFEPCE